MDPLRAPFGSKETSVEGWALRNFNVAITADKSKRPEDP